MSDRIWQNLTTNYSQGLKQLKEATNNNAKQIYETLLEALAHKDPAVRAVIPRTLFDTKILNDETRDEVVSRYIDLVLNDPDDDVKREMAKAIDRLKNYYRHKKGKFITEKMVSGLDSASAVTRSMTIWMLMRFREQSVNQRLLQMIVNDPDAEVRSRAAVTAIPKKDIYEAFMALGDVAKQAVVDALDDSEDYFQQLAATYLRRYPDEETLNILMEFTQRTDVSDFLKMKAQESITWLTNKGVAKTNLQKALTSDDPAKQMATAKTYQAVLAKDPSEIEALVNMLSTEDANLREAAAIALVRANDAGANVQLITAIFDGRVRFHPVGYAMSNQSRIAEMEHIAKRAQTEADNNVKAKIASDHTSLREYIERMSRLY